MAYDVDYADIKAKVSIEQAAKLLTLELRQEKHQLRGKCPACGDNDPRKLVLTPSRNIFYCFTAKTGGSCLDLVCHITGLELREAGQFLNGSPSPTQREEREQEPSAQKPSAARTEKSQPAPTHFDPEEYASKLSYSDEVKALGISEDDAQKLGIGYATKGLMRGRVCFTIRNSDGSVAGFAGYNEEGLKLPSKWLSPKVLEFKKRA